MADFSFVDRLPQTISTARLILRAPSRRDVAALARLANTKAVHKWLARLPHPYTQADAIEFIDNIARSPGEHAYAILTRDEAFIGTIGLHLLKDGPELGYWLGEPYWGEGYATEAVSALAEAADEAGCETLAARAQSDNHASIRVLEKAGFEKTGEAVDNCGPHMGVAVTSLRRERRR